MTLYQTLTQTLPWACGGEEQVSAYVLRASQWRTAEFGPEVPESAAEVGLHPNFPSVPFGVVCAMRRSKLSCCFGCVLGWSCYWIPCFLGVGDSRPTGPGRQ